MLLDRELQLRILAASAALAASFNLVHMIGFMESVSLVTGHEACFAGIPSLQPSTSWQ
jgi:hypothetical protein